MRLLRTLDAQKTNGSFQINVFIVDNDSQESAREIVFSAKTTLSLPIFYAVEPEQNISLARNRALKMADGDYLACIDDDEYPKDGWLLSFYNTITAKSTDGVLGPVIPDFETRPPSWLTSGALLSRKCFPTGTVLTRSKDTRSGNFMISRKILNEDENDKLFNPKFGTTGGEDSDFFGRMIARGYIFIWCNEARVYENVPPERLTRKYFLRRALLRGEIGSKISPLLSLDTLKSFGALFLYTLALPFLLLFMHSFFMPYLIRDTEHAGKLLARCGLSIVRSRSDL